MFEETDVLLEFSNADDEEQVQENKDNGTTKDETNEEPDQGPSPQD